MSTTTQQAPPTERLINLREVARRYGVHPKTALRFIAEGTIPAPLKTKIGNRLVWRESEITRHIDGLQ